MEPRALRRVILVLAVLAVASVGCIPPATTPPLPTTTTTSTTAPATRSALAWGYDAFGNVGDDPSPANRPSPASVALPTGVSPTVVSAGAFGSFALADGTIYAWGRGDSGQLGNGSTPLFQGTPVVVSAPAGVRFTALSAGGTHVLALGDDGRAYAWGDDAEGQLGNDSAYLNQSTPVVVAVPAGVRFTSISAGYAHSLAIGDDGRTYSWGYDGFGELGDGASGVDQPTPVQVVTPPGVTFRSLAAGGHHNLAIGDDGKAYSWGWDQYGQLGDDAVFTDHLTPVPVAAPAGVTFATVVSGEHHSMAISTSGDAYAWGQDSNGQVGNDAALVNQPLPVAVALPAGTKVRSIAGGGYHTVAATTDGRAYSWGYDDDGELGDGLPLADRGTPGLVATASGVSVQSVVAGYYHVVAIVTST